MLLYLVWVMADVIYTTTDLVRSLFRSCKVLGLRARLALQEGAISGTTLDKIAPLRVALLVIRTK